MNPSETESETINNKKKEDNTSTAGLMNNTYSNNYHNESRKMSLTPKCLLVSHD